MEKIGFEKVLKSLKDEGIIPEQITTDRDVQIRKYLKEEESNITHRVCKEYQKEVGLQLRRMLKCYERDG